MSKFICAVSNAFSPYSMARVAHKLGMEETATRILESNFGKQFGRTSESGLRAFSYTNKEGVQHIELIDKDFRRRGCARITRYGDGRAAQFNRFLFNNGKTIQTNMIKYKNPITLLGAQPQDVKYSHFISESGPGIKQRVGDWSICLPGGKRIINRNDDHILDYMIR